jgi:hypothetical protein
MNTARHAEALPDQSPAAKERRVRADLRDIFEEIIRKVEPFFQKATGLNGGPTEYWAARVIHDAHPDLTHHDVKILINAAARYYREQAVPRKS